MNMRLLLVEPEPEEAIFLREVLTEIEEERHFRPWIHLDTLHAETWEDAETILLTETIDVVLLNPDLGDSRGFETLRRSQMAAPGVPVVLLLNIGDEALGVRLVREGAQDFLIRREVDCAPLAHALRNAVERHRLVTAAQAARFKDPLTGLPNQSCFSILADRDRILAEKLGHRWMVLLAEVRDLDRLVEAYGEQRRDLALVESTELLRGLAGATDQLYRIGPCRFALTSFESGSESLEKMRGRIERAVAGHGVVLGSAVYSPSKPASLEDLVGGALVVLAASETNPAGFAEKLAFHSAAG